MNIEQISQIIERLERSTVDDFEVEVDGFVLRGHFSLRTLPSSNSNECSMPLAASATKPSASTDTTIVKSPSMGKFTATHPLTQATSSLDPGRNLVADEILGFIISGTVIQPILAPKASILRQCLVEQDQVIGYAQPLFELS